MLINAFPPEKILNFANLKAVRLNRTKFVLCWVLG